jgi:hypothetical protein
MGLSQGGYLGKKLVTTGAPTLNSNSMLAAAVQPARSVMVQGSSLGQTKGGNLLLMDDLSIPTTEWTDTAITFNVPNPKPGRQDVNISAVVNGQTTNKVRLTVGMFGLNSIAGASVAPGAPMKVQGFGLDTDPGQLLMGGNPIATITSWEPTAIAFDVPDELLPGTPWPNGQTTVQISARVNGQTTNAVPLVVSG